MTPVLLGVCTGVIDFYVHPGSLGSVATEGIVTGILVGLLSLLVALFIQRKKQTGTDYD